MEGGGSSASGDGLKFHNGAQLGEADDTVQGTSLQGRHRPGKEPANQFLSPNNRLVLHGINQEDVKEDDDEYVFEEDEEAVQMPKRWLSVARFFSGQVYSTRAMFEEMRKAWGLKEVVPYRELGDNRFLLEFGSEALVTKVTQGGPWRHKWDALIFVPYDGVKRLLEVVIESIGLWIRFYDIPVDMMTDGFARALGGKVGRVLQVGEAVQDYKRVKVALIFLWRSRSCTLCKRR